MRYRVESWNDPANPHTVDLSEAGGMGICSCRDCQTTVARNRKRFPGKWVFYGTPDKPNRDRTLCRHIEAAHKRFSSDDHPPEHCRQTPPQEMKPDFLLGKIALAYALPDQRSCRGIPVPGAECASWAPLPLSKTCPTASSPVACPTSC